MTNSADSPATAADVFISYSSEDRDKIAPIVQIVRALKKTVILQDHVSITPGERWRPKVMEAIERARTVIVFWCEHSAASEHVREEYEAGIARSKDILPILLDDTELPGPLRALHPEVQRLTYLDSRARSNTSTSRCRRRVLGR